MSADDEGPLSRWSRRKAETREKQAALKKEDGTPPLEEEPAEVPAKTGAGSQPEEAAPPDLPHIDSLDAESDFTVFMREGVPDELRNLALRKLWRSDPELTVLDELLEYGEDYAGAAGILENVETAWKIGKGYADEQPEPEGEAEGMEGEAESAESEDIAEVGAADQSAENVESAADDDGPADLRREPPPKAG